MKRASSPHRTESASNLIVPIATVASAPRLLADAGAGIADVARSAGLDPDRFDDPTQTISFTEIGRYLTACFRVTGDDTFALRLGLAEGLTALTPVGYLAQHSPDVRAAFVELRDHVHHFAGAIEVTEDDGVAFLEYRFLLPRIPGAGLIVEAGMGIGVSILRQLCGPAWNPIEVRLTRGLSQHPSEWQRCVQAPVRFGAENNLLIFSAQWLEHRIERANAEFRRLLHKRVAQLDAEHGEDLSLQVCSVIRASLLAGDASARRVASRLGLSPRTLRRRLSGQQTSFAALVDSTRFEVACYLLEHSTASLTQIADLLGYAHCSALSRAFRRWAGLSSGEWRAQRSKFGQRELSATD
jgi:AraC-like DNA-binding protein